MKSIKSQVINSTKWTLFEKIGVQGVQFLLGLIMARLLSPEDYGIVGMLSVFLVISTAFVDSGFSNALIRKQEYKEIDYSTVFYFNLVISLFLYICLFFAAPYIANFFEMPILRSVLRVQASTLVINALVVVQVAKLTRDLNFKALALRTTFSSLISGICGVCFAYLGFGVWAIVYQGILHSLINCFFLFVYCRWLPKTGFSIASFKELGSYGSKLLASSLLHTLYTQLTTLIVGKFYSATTLGFYNRAQQTVHLPRQLFSGVIGKTTFPILAKVQDDAERLVIVYRKYIKMSSLCMFFVYSLLFALAKPIVLLLLTDKWLDCVPYLQLLCFASMFDNVTSINLNLLKVIGRSDLFLKLEIIKKTISIIMIFAAIPFGVTGICISLIIYEQLAIFVNTYYTGKIFNLGYLTQWKDFGLYLIVSLLSIIPAFLLSLTSLPNIVIILLGSMLALIIYMLLLWKNEAMIEVRSTVISSARKYIHK